MLNSATIKPRVPETFMPPLNTWYTNNPSQTVVNPPRLPLLFQIFSADGSTQVGSINYQWDQMQASYYLCLQFPGQIADTRHKALLLGAAFLLVRKLQTGKISNSKHHTFQEYLYFEGAKKSGYCKCIC